MKIFVTALSALTLSFTCAHSSVEIDDTFNTTWKTQARQKFGLTEVDINSLELDIKSPEDWASFKQNNFYLAPQYETIEDVKTAVEKQKASLNEQLGEMQKVLAELEKQVKQWWPDPAQHPSRQPVDFLKTQIMGAVLNECPVDRLSIIRNVREAYQLPQAIYASESPIRRKIHEAVYSQRVISLENGQHPVTKQLVPLINPQTGKPQQSPMTRLFHLKAVGSIFTILADTIFGKIIPDCFQQAVAGPYTTRGEASLEAYKQRHQRIAETMQFFINMEKELLLWNHNAVYNMKTGEPKLTFNDAAVLTEYWASNIIERDGGMIILPGISADVLQSTIDLFWAHQTIGLYELYLRGVSSEVIRELFDLPVAIPRACWLNIGSIVTVYNTERDPFSEGIEDQRGVCRYPHPVIMLERISWALEQNCPTRIYKTIALMAKYKPVEKGNQLTEPFIQMIGILSDRALAKDLSDILSCVQVAINAKPLTDVELAATWEQARDLFAELIGYSQILGDPLLEAYDEYNPSYLDNVSQLEKDLYVKAWRLLTEYSSALKTFATYLGKDVLHIKLPEPTALKDLVRTLKVEKN